MNPELSPKLIISEEGKSGIFRKINEFLTITDWTAFVLGLNGFGAGQDGTDYWITDDSPLLWEKSSTLHSTRKSLTANRKSCWLRCLHLAATGETLVVVWRPAGAVRVMLVLKEAGLWVFFQLLHVFREVVVKLPVLLLLPPGPELTGVWHMDLEEHEGKD